MAAKAYVALLGREPTFIASDTEAVRSRLLTVEGWGHTSFFARSACADRAVSLYLLQVVLPAPGTVCAVDHVPFTAEGRAGAAARRSEAARAFLIPAALRRAMAD